VERIRCRSRFKTRSRCWLASANNPKRGWAAGFGKRFSLGVLAGIGWGDDLKTTRQPTPFSAGQRPDSNSPIFGALLEFAIHRDLSVEADGIYRALHATDLATIEGDVRFAVLTWEFPLMAKYRISSFRGGRPFVELGPSFRLSGNLHGPAPSHYGITALRPAPVCRRPSAD
jgi:hypothetical protein